MASNKDSKAMPDTWPVLMLDDKEFTDEFERLRYNILLNERDRTVKTLLVASSAKGEGNSTICVNFAASLARSEKSDILLLDANFRNPALGSLFGVGHSPGISNILAGEADLVSCLRKVLPPRLYLLPAGDLPANPAIILGTDKFDQLMQSLRERFVHVIIDSPPALAYPDAILLSQKVDGVVLVVRVHGTRREVIKRAIAKFNEAGANLLGTVLNRRRYVIPEAVYRRI